MAQYHIYVNPAKRQYIDPARFDENMTASTYLQGNHATAIALLACNPAQVSCRGASLHSYGQMAGSWFGDRIYAAGDDWGCPDEFGIKTATEEDPDRNLYELAQQEYEDISYQTIAMMCEGRFDDVMGISDLAEELAERARKSEGALIEYGNVVLTIGCIPLERALEKIIGNDWTQIYEAAYKERPWYSRSRSLPGS